jgi:hypothetical protein
LYIEAPAKRSNQLRQFRERKFDWARLHGFWGISSVTPPPVVASFKTHLPKTTAADKTFDGAGS